MVVWKIITTFASSKEINNMKQTIKFVPPCKFKDGDIVAISSGAQVFILKRENGDGTGYCYIGYDFERNKPFHANVWAFSRLATEEEKKKLFDAIKLNGYKWNVETKTLEKLIQPNTQIGDAHYFLNTTQTMEYRIHVLL